MRLHLSAPLKFTEFLLKMFSEFSLKAVTVQRLTELMSMKKYTAISKRQTKQRRYFIRGKTKRITRDNLTFSPQCDITKHLGLLSIRWRQSNADSDAIHFPSKNVCGQWSCGSQDRYIIRSI